MEHKNLARRRAYGSHAPTKRTAIAATTLVVAGLPVLAALVFGYVWSYPTPYEALVLLGLYLAAALGISLGFHRLFTHRGFRCSSRMRVLLAAMGSLAFEGSLASWVANHRAHHAHTDLPGDPHSPWTTSPGLRGFLHAHIGWLYQPGADPERMAKDVLADPPLRIVSRFWWAIALMGLLLPALIAGFLSGWSSFWSMLLWSGLFRVILFHHVTWSINSVCHIYGHRVFDTGDRSGNVAWLAVLSLGESWHNNHHASPRAARHGVVHGQLDLSAMILAALERLGLVHAVVWPPRLPKGR